jgi:hypothetical protein
MESFDFPLRDSSVRSLSKTTDFGGHLVTRVAEQVSGATNIQLQLYQATVTLGGIYTPSETLEQMEKIIQDLCNDAWIEPAITTTLHSSARKKEASNGYVHLFGKLSVRIYEVQQRRRWKSIRQR